MCDKARESLRHLQKTPRIVATALAVLTCVTIAFAAEPDQRALKALDSALAAHGGPDAWEGVDSLSIIAKGEINQRVRYRAYTRINPASVLTKKSSFTSLRRDPSPERSTRPAMTSACGGVRPFCGMTNGCSSTSSLAPLVGAKIQRHRPSAKVYSGVFHTLLFKKPEKIPAACAGAAAAK